MADGQMILNETLLKVGKSPKITGGLWCNKTKTYDFCMILIFRFSLFSKVTGTVLIKTVLIRNNYFLILKLLKTNLKE